MHRLATASLPFANKAASSLAAQSRRSPALTTPATPESGRPDAAWRPRLRFLPDSRRRPQDPPCFPARSGTIRQDVGEHPRRAGRVRHLVPPPRFQHIPDRPATPRTRRARHSRRDRQSHARRSVLVREFPHGRVAPLLPRQPVPPIGRGIGTVLPPNDAQYGRVRRRADSHGRSRADGQNGRRHPCHPLPRRRAGLACSHQKR